MSDKERINEFIEAEKAEDGKTNIEVANLSEKVKKSFLEYAMSVIVARAIPDVKDGMKDVYKDGKKNPELNKAIHRYQNGSNRGMKSFFKETLDSIIF